MIQAILFYRPLILNNLGRILENGEQVIAIIFILC